ncbi:MAG: hypothetical protein ACI4EC_00995 [Lachnospiraceae bacterium]
MSEWKVLFDTNFWGSVREEDPAFEVGTEMERPLPTVEHPVNQTVSWCGETWKILSIYTCEKGLVVDYCKQTDPKELAAFVRKFRAAGLEEDFDEELFERLQLENPSAPNVLLRMSRGAVELPCQGSSGLHYMPVDPYEDPDSDAAGGEVENDPVVLACMEHYGLEEAFSYSISRAHFLWDEGHAEDLSGLTVTFYEQDVHVPGEHFTLTGGKQEISLVHPVSGENYMLYIDHIEANELPEEHLERMNSIRRDDEQEMMYPTHFETVCYAVEPETGADQLCLKACAKGDSPIAKGRGSIAASSVAVIGGSCGPTSIFVAGKVKSEIHLKSICSPLFFEPTPVREWYVTYYVKRREDLRVELAW